MEETDNVIVKINKIIINTFNKKIKKYWGICFTPNIISN